MYEISKQIRQNKSKVLIQTSFLNYFNENGLFHEFIDFSTSHHIYYGPELVNL